MDRLCGESVSGLLSLSLLSDLVPANMHHQREYAPSAVRNMNIHNDLVEKMTFALFYSCVC